MAAKRILIVDDDWDILFLLGHSLKRLSPDLEVVTTQEPIDAWQEVEKQPFDLVLTDHMMPGKTGVELAQDIRAKYPKTKIILMTAYETNRIDLEGNEDLLTDFIRKPFKLPELQAKLKQLLTVSTDDKTIPSADGTGSKPVVDDQAFKLLQDLWYKTGSDFVLLSTIDRRNKIIHIVGETDRNIAVRVAAFVSNSSLAVAELASLMGDNESRFHSSYHEGNRYNIYVYFINRALALTLVFGANNKPGPIWIDAKKTAGQLAELF